MRQGASSLLGVGEDFLDAVTYYDLLHAWIITH